MKQVVFFFLIALSLQQPAWAAESEFGAIAGTFSLADYAKHFAPNEPAYIVVGWVRPQLKFQLSFRYLFFNPAGSWAEKQPWITGFNFAFSQTGLMDVSTLDESFFYDTSYRPEVFYYFEHPVFSWQLGVGHESNGFKEPEHKSINILFARPILTIGPKNSNFFFTIAPKVYYYFGPISLNPDIANYRGYCDLKLVTGWRDGVQLSGVGRLGSDFDKGSLELNLTYSLSNLTSDNFDVQLMAQYFVGYGETLISYKQTSNMLRFGISLIR